MFGRTIRLAQAAAVHCRERGLLAHEYEQQALNATPWYRRLGEKDGPRFSGAAAGLAEDYQVLAEEILAAYSTRQQALAALVGGG